MRRFALATLALCACESMTGLVHEAPFVPPTPLFTVAYTSGASDWLRVPAVCLVGDAPAGAADRLNQLAARAGIVVGGSCEWRISFVTSAPALSTDAQAALSAANRDEAHAVVTTFDGQGPTSTVYAPKGARYALDNLFAATAPSQVHAHRLVPAETIVDYPELPVRGVIEGFYGQPFDAGGRAALLYEMAEARENTYVYAPQNDDDDHLTWWLPYGTEAIAELSESAAIADELGIDFAWAVQPGEGAFYQTSDPIIYGSAADFERLTTKIDQVRAAGVHNFGLFFDDNITTLTWPSDIAEFGSLAAAQVSLVNRLDDWLQGVEPTAQLWFIGTAYNKLFDGWQTYNSTLRDNLHASVRVLWTGNETYSPTIAVDDLTDVTQSLGRQPFIWDNWPYPDVTALTGRDPQLGEAVGGLLSNAVMCSWQAKTAIQYTDVTGTAGMYAWGGARYDASTALATWKTVRPTP